jgi:hypothetical protein
MPDSRKGNWPKVAIGGLILLNLVLLAMLVLRDPTATRTAEPAVTPAGSTSSRPTPTPTETEATGDQTPSADPTPSASESSASPTATDSPSDAERSTRMLAVSSDTLAWRAVFGRCPTDAELEVSRDGGRTWRSTSTGLRSVSRIRAYSDTSVFAVGGATDCETRYVATGGPGESWEPNEQLLRQTWYRVPRQPNRVHAPSGRESEPCDERLQDFAGLGDQGAAALCVGGTVRTTQDSGRTWRDLDGTSAALALGADQQVYVVAIRRDSCDGVALALLDPGAEEIAGGVVRCAPVGRDQIDQVAVGVRDQVMWLWLGDEVQVSTDRGRTWELSA